VCLPLYFAGGALTVIVNVVNRRRAEDSLTVHVGPGPATLWQDLVVRDVISPQQDLRIGTGSPDRPDLSRALIGGACRSWQWAPLAQRHIKERPAGARDQRSPCPQRRHKP
jgi:hypothetical protein